MRRFTLITIILLFLLLAVVAIIQISAGRGGRLPCADDPACRSPGPTPSVTAS